MKKKNFVILFFLFSSVLAYSNYPEIKNLHKSDSLFSQIQYELGEYYIRTQSGKSLIPLSIYRYKFKKNDSLFSISSKLNLTYDSIVTLNGIENPDKISSGDILLIPNSPGIFINKSPMGKFEELISLRDEKGTNIIINRSNMQISCTFLSGSYLSGNERAFFLKSFFRLPLDNIYATSGFGYRNNPISGIREFHTGLDFRAITGSPVYASKEGIISDTGILGNYGLYIIIKHNGGYETVYSHLNRINVKENDTIISGQIIAESGNTGISTGPHLHFEIRKNGIPLNPIDFFPGDNE